ncbi:MAG TPA: TetR/AcrR family transcriptional regulator [Mycobacterium sp.]
MMSISNDQVSVDERILDAAASCVLAMGFGRVTLAEIARRAGVSRPTVYRRWPDTRSVLASLLTARVTGALTQVPTAGTGRAALVARVVAMAELLRHDPVIMEVLHHDPELAMVYIVERMGTSQRVVFDALVDGLTAAQRDGSVRAGDPRRLAAMVQLITQSTIQSAQIVSPILGAQELAEELTYALNGYLS